jgi:membrane associated rhomboid family serine protease
LVPLKDNVPSLRVPAATLVLIVGTIVLWVIGWEPALTDTWWLWAALASLFVTDNLLELVVNMVFLWLFAKSLEDALGPVRFVALFVLAGVGAAGAQELIEPDTIVPSVGVAGAIAGLIGAYALSFPRARILCWVLIPFFVTFVEIPALVLAAVWFALQTIPEIGQPPLAGLVGGLALGLAAIKVLAIGRPSVAIDSARAAA